jgi:hypothetical protein
MAKGMSTGTSTVLAVMLIGIVGCSEPPSIVQYRAPKDPPPVVSKRQDPSGNREARLVAAVIPHGADVWFLRATAAPALIDRHLDEMRSIAVSLKFQQDGSPQWTLPAGWQELPGDTIRFRTLRGPADSTGESIELAVTTLPFPGGDWDSYLLANVNRWRGQVGLEPLAPSALHQVVTSLRTQSGDTIYWCDFQVERTGSEQAGNTGASPTSSEPPVASVTPLLQIGTVPPGWQPLPSDALRQAAYAVVEGDSKGEVTVIALGPQSGSVADNVNRWRGQIGLAPVSEAEIHASRRSITVGGVEADYFILESESEHGEAIRGVIARRPDRVWFIKFRGPVDLVRRQGGAFEQFVAHLRIP